MFKIRRRYESDFMIEKLALTASSKTNCKRRYLNTSPYRSIVHDEAPTIFHHTAVTSSKSLWRFFASFPVNAFRHDIHLMHEDRKSISSIRVIRRCLHAKQWNLDGSKKVFSKSCFQGFTPSLCSRRYSLFHCMRSIQRRPLKRPSKQISLSMTATSQT